MKSMSGERIVTEALDGASVHLSVGERLVISLPENPTTGFRWELEPPGSQFLSVVEDTFRLEGMQAGAVGTRTITLRAEVPFSGGIRLRLQRAWEPEHVLRTLAFDLSCDEPNASVT